MTREVLEPFREELMDAPLHEQFSTRSMSPKLSNVDRSMLGTTKGPNATSIAGRDNDSQVAITMYKQALTVDEPLLNDSVDLI